MIMSRKKELIAAIRNEMIRVMREEQLEFMRDGDMYVFPEEHLRILRESQSITVLNLLSPMNSDFQILEEDNLEECTETSFGGVITIPTIGNSTFNGSAGVNYSESKIDISLDMPLTLYSK